MATIKRRGNSYLIRCYDGYSHNGKQIERTMTWKIPDGMTEKKAEKEAILQAALFEERVRTGQIAEQKIKFSDFAEKWFSDYAENQLRPKTIKRYRGLMQRITPAIGHIYLDRLRPTHLTAFYKDLTQITKVSKYYLKVDLRSIMNAAGVTQRAFAASSQISETTLRSLISGNAVNLETAEKISFALSMEFDKLFIPTGEPEPLSGQTILHYHRLISVILQTAVEWQYIPSNPAERVKAPKATNQEAEYLDDKQAVRLLEQLEKQPIYYKTAIEVLLFTGMRRGELLGLQWEDIDFNNQLITIKRSLQYLPDRGVFKDETKTKSSHRVIKVPLTAMNSLRHYKTWCKLTQLQNGIPWNESSQILITQNGTPMHPDTLTSWFRSFIQTTDLPQIHVHSLRHTNATLQIANGVSVTTVAGNLGHSNANTTTKVYAHAIQSAAVAAAEMMDNLLDVTKKRA